MMGSVLLLLPGEIRITPLIRAYVARADYIIAVDGGMIHASDLGLTPDIWVGDFDSVKDVTLFSRYAEIPKRPYPSDKDVLDSEIALNLVLEQGATECILLGGIGGRVDHALTLHMMPLQFTTLNFIHTDGKVCLMSIRGAQNKGDLDNTPTKIPVVAGQTFSLIPLQNCMNLTLSGAKWPLNNVELKTGSGWGVSNIALADMIEVVCDAGVLWCVISLDLVS